jgi:hypothetical protein
MSIGRPALRLLFVLDNSLIAGYIASQPSAKTATERKDYKEKV